jgi:hypothetical protein
MSSPPPKPIAKYRTLVSCQVGKLAEVLATNHPSSSYAGPLQTSPVSSYDETKDVFETQNTRYVPGPFAKWPDGEDCPVHSR